MEASLCLPHLAAAGRPRPGVIFPFAPAQGVAFAIQQVAFLRQTDDVRVGVLEQDVAGDEGLVRVG